MDLTIEQTIQKATLALLSHPKYRSLGGVIMMGEVSLDDDYPTACTDGLNVTYGKKFVAGLSDAQLRFLILHENMHKALLHLTTRQWMWKENPQLANLACDHVINLLLVLSDDGDNFIQMPPMGAFDLQYQGMDAGEVYRKLKEDGNDGGGCEGFDHHDWGKARQLTEQEKEALADKVTEALQQGSILAGKEESGLDRAVRDLLAPKINWREVLRDFVMSICAGKDLSSWRRPNRRHLHNGIYLPSHFNERAGRVLVGVDTSGSVDGAMLVAFLAEVASIATTVQPEVVDLLYWDTRVAAHEKYSEGQYDMLAQSTKPKGGGGTSPECVTRHMRETSLRPDCAIMLTDGHVGGEWGGAWPCPVLWCITTKNIIAGNGQTIHLEV
jgi:predicted metal-dependent peptidase